VKFLKWRFRHKFGLFGAMFYLFNAVIMILLFYNGGPTSALFFGIMSVLLSILWFVFY